MYYSAQIFLLGAEFTWVYAHTFGSFKQAPQPATPTRSDNEVSVPEKAAVAPPAEQAHSCKTQLDLHPFSLGVYLYTYGPTDPETARNPGFHPRRD